MRQSGFRRTDLCGEKITTHSPRPCWGGRVAVPGGFPRALTGAARTARKWNPSMSTVICDPPPEITGCLNTLEQCLVLLAMISDTDYTASPQGFCPVGAHLRHCLEGRQ